MRALGLVLERGSHVGAGTLAGLLPHTLGIMTFVEVGDGGMDGRLILVG